jgi:hypothetical protein
MLQQFRHQFDHVVYGSESTEGSASHDPGTGPVVHRLPEGEWPAVKSVVIVETSHTGQKTVSLPGSGKKESPSFQNAVHGTGQRMPETPPRAIAFQEIWDQEMRSARRKLEPEGALTGATREIQAGLGSFLQICHEHGVKVGPWRLQHVVGEWTFGDHPTYGVITIAHWVCKDGQPWKVGVGLFLGRGPAKPKDLSTKISSLDVEPAVIDHLILLRPEDDLALSGKSKSLWQDAERRGRHARLEAVSLDNFAVLYGIPRFMTAATETQAGTHPMPNLADLIQEKCEKLLEQVCMPVQGA